MKSFLLSLVEGVQENDLTPDQLRSVRELVGIKAVKCTKNLYKLSDKHRVGKIDVAINGTGYLEVFDHAQMRKDLLVESTDLNGAMKGDLVVVKRLFAKSGRPKAKVVAILKRAFASSVVYTRTLHKKIIGVNIKTGLNVDIVASQKSLKELPENTVLKIDNATGTITEILGVLSDPKVDEKISLALFDKHEFFSLEAEAEAKSHGNSVDKSFYPDRVDLTHLPFCTIDPPDAKDFDDAVYFDKEACALYVAIADVSEYVFAFGPTDKEAKERGFSIYFPHKSIPMLPRSLSENICSLKPNEDRLAFCFKITLDKTTLTIKNEELMNVVIHSHKRYTYDRIDEFLDGHLNDQDDADKKILPWLLPLRDTIFKVRKKRLENAFEFRSEETRMRVDEDQNILSTAFEIETPSHSLIEDCMLLANKAAAKRIDYGVFRNHESPSFERIEDLLVDLEMIGLVFNFTPDLPKLIKDIQTQADALNIRQDVDKLIIKSQKKALYEAENKGHFGLGFNKYSHFTSPIRRYSDLVLHRLLKAQLEGNQKKFDFQLANIENLCVSLSELERESDKVAWDYMDRKFARWAALHVGEDFEAIISDVGKNVIGKLDDKLKGARLFVMDDDVELLERVKVKIVEADIAGARIFVRVSGRLDP